MWLFKTSKNFWAAWKEKFWTLFVSAKIILFFSCLALATTLLIYGYIDKGNWTSVVITDITVIAGFRGLMQIASVFGNRKGQVDNSEFSGPTQNLRFGAQQELMQMGGRNISGTDSMILPSPPISGQPSSIKIIKQKGFDDINDP